MKQKGIVLEFEKTLIYGKKPTTLRLSEKAEHVYSKTDSINIYEDYYFAENPDGTADYFLFYRIEGRKGEPLHNGLLTETEVNKWLEQDYFED